MGVVVLRNVDKGQAELLEVMIINIIKALTYSLFCFCCLCLKGRKIPKHSLKGSEVVDRHVDRDGIVLRNINEGQASRNNRDTNWLVFKSFLELKETETITEFIGSILNN